MSSDAPVMPLYVADYLADTMRLTTEQHGAYLLLIMEYWMKGPLPDDDALLCRVVRMEMDRWRSLRHILEPFFIHKDNAWCHKRVDKEFAKVAATKKPPPKPAQDSLFGPAPTPEPEVEDVPKRAARIKTGWKPSPEDRLRARQLGFTDAAIDWEIEHFINYWLGRSDSRGAKADWSATFRNHLMANADGRRSGNPFLGRASSNRPEPGSIVSALRDLIDADD